MLERTGRTPRHGHVRNHVRPRQRHKHQPGSPQPDKQRPPHVRLVKYVVRIYERYDNHRCALMASACAYCAILSLVPLILVAIAALGFFFGGNQGASRRVISSIQAYAPNNAGYVDGVQAIVDHVLRDRHLLGIFGILGLIWAAHQVFVALQQTMNVIFDAHENRSLLHQRFVAIGAAFATLVVLILNIGAAISFDRLEAVVDPHFSSAIQLLLRKSVTVIVSAFLVWYLFTALYSALPACKVSRRGALLGAGIAAAFWVISLVGFGAYIHRFNGYDRLYGPLAGLAILVVWSYYCMAILLVGAEIAADYGVMTSSKYHIVDPSAVSASSGIYNSSESNSETQEK